MTLYLRPVLIRHDIAFSLVFYCSLQPVASKEKKMNDVHTCIVVFWMVHDQELAPQLATLDLLCYGRAVCWGWSLGRLGTDPN